MIKGHIILKKLCYNKHFNLAFSRNIDAFGVFFFLPDGSAMTELRRALEEYLSVLSGLTKKGLKVFHSSNSTPFFFLFLPKNIEIY